jgi:hypothetical protein
VVTDGTVHGPHPSLIAPLVGQPPGTRSPDSVEIEYADGALRAP